jgi:hypothetical protein
MENINISDKEQYTFEKYPKLSSSKFTYENSCRNIGCQFPDFYKIESGNDRNWTILGYTLNPPFDSNVKEPLAIMYENTKTFDIVWYHHDLDMFKEVKVSILKNNINR